MRDVSFTRAGPDDLRNPQISPLFSGHCRSGLAPEPEHFCKVSFVLTIQAERSYGTQSFLAVTVVNMPSDATLSRVVSYTEAACGEECEVRPRSCLES